MIKRLRMSDTAIKFENISKQYRLGLVSTKTLSHDLNRWWQTSVLHKEDPYLKIGDTNDRATKGESEYVWALRDIDFEVKQGDVLGIIGKNGAGKSTLLKILSRVTTPTTGIIKAQGRIASLLEVGTGFHPEMTGRENIYMNGAILGMTKKEIDSKLDEIVEFAGVARYLDTPVKRYSSGMTVRLGFSIAAHLEPEILVVDEVLAVGDAEFQKKAIGKMQDVAQGEGRTVLFVSHNMGAIETLCTRGIVLKDGRLDYAGDIPSSINHYLANKTTNVEEQSILNGISMCNSNMIINEILINGKDNNVVYIDENHSALHFEFRGELKDEKKIALEVRLYDFRGIIQALYSPGHLNGNTKTVEAGTFYYSETVKLPPNLTKGEFLLDISLTHPNIEYLLDINQQVKILSKGVIGSTGLEFNYRDCGLLMLS
jgi:lipopolysaccharide transport system ATP-binding protein